MKIQVDEAGKVAINSLCDAALKSGGIQNLKPINEILASVTVEAPVEVPVAK